MDLVFISTSAQWWDRLSPLKQREHISRHPKGKVAKKVVGGKLKLKPVRKHGDPMPIGETADTPDEERKLQRYAHVDLDTIKEANSEETEKGAASEQAASTKVDGKLPTTHHINRILSKASPEVKAGVRDFYDNLGKIKSSPPKPHEIPKLVQDHPNDDQAIVDAFHSDHPKALLATLKALKPVTSTYVKAAGVAGLFGLALVAGSAVPAIFAIAYLSQKLSDHIDAKEEAQEAERKRKSGDSEAGDALEEAEKKRKDAEFERLVASKKAKLSREDFKKWKDQIDEWRSTQSQSSFLSMSHSEEDDGVVTLAHDFDRWFKSIDIKQLADDYKVTSTSAAGLRLILSPTLKYFDEVHHKQYLLVQGNDLLGTVNWDNSMGDPHPDTYGWKATLRDGFPESSYHTGRDPNNKFAPYTLIHKGEIKLHNPTRMNLDTAYSWAKSIYKGMQDAKDESEEDIGDTDPESEL
jgi:hypothetical protein